MDMEILEEVKKIIKKNERLIVGVSGGVDSAVLLDILAKVKKDLSLEIIVAHLNHGLRKDAIIDQNLVYELAKKYNYKFVVRKIKLPRKNIEEAGREARYKFFNEVLNETKADSIVTAHTKNDQAETVLLNLARGAGLKGLKGMEQISGNLKRPFLNVSREAILAYARENKLKWREDPSNKDLSFARNRVRLKVIPELAKINPKIVDNVKRSAEILKELDDFLSEHFKKEFKALKEDENLTFGLKKLKRLPEFLQKEILAEAIREIDPKALSTEHLENILKIIKTDGTKETSLGRGLKAMKIYDRLVIGPLKLAPEAKHKKKLLGSLKWDDYSFEAKKAKLDRETPDSVFIDGEKIKELYIRGWKEGDFIYFDPKRKRKKLSNLFIDNKVPKIIRRNYPIIVNESDEVVWVPFLKLNSKLKAGKTAKKVINLKVKLNEKK
ncbi:MAG: tRNA lysidine(34) synthetase TilS [Patescibacteria group bacterium]|nr:tRNA lysidine(34) synthetase TilS [Patescibacteria group bacterium]